MKDISDYHMVGMAFKDTEVVEKIEEQQGRVLVNGDLSPVFEVNNGGKQGDLCFLSYT